MKCATPYCRKPAAPKRDMCHRCRKASWRALHPMKAAFNTLRDHAREREIFFALDLDTFSRFARVTHYLNRRGPFGHSLTVDRIDNLRGYEPGNIRALTRRENSVKRAKYDQCRMRAGHAKRKS